MTRRPILVIYGTTDGQTARIAVRMADILRDLGWPVNLVNARDADDVRCEDYEGVIVAASVHAGGYQRTVRRWVRANSAGLAGRFTTFVSVCLGVLERSARTDAELDAIMGRFFAEAHWWPNERKIVAGALLYTKYWWLKRVMLRRIVAKAHGDTDTSRDYEYTDWNDLTAFTRGWPKRAQLENARGTLAS